MYLRAQMRHDPDYTKRPTFLPQFACRARSQAHWLKLALYLHFASSVSSHEHNLLDLHIFPNCFVLVIFRVRLIVPNWRMVKIGEPVTFFVSAHVIVAALLHVCIRNRGGPRHVPYSVDATVSTPQFKTPYTASYKLTSQGPGPQSAPYSKQVTWPAISSLALTTPSCARRWDESVIPGNTHAKVSNVRRGQQHTLC